MDSGLALDEYQRYGRQMILDGFGLPGWCTAVLGDEFLTSNGYEGQLKLRRSSVVVVGAGGLGCPALQYLAAAGVGKIGIIDHDVVELSNLQRQILHAEARLGQPKASSAAQAIKQVNSLVQVDTHIVSLSSLNAVDLLSPYDIILDCTDNPPTRYLLSDVAVLLKKPLISGAAQKYEGQLCIYGLGDQGPCYRCLFPKPPKPESVGSCQETGILGAVTGIIGNLQALEAIKLVTGLHDGKPCLLLYSCLSPTPFRTIKIRSKKLDCPACGHDGQKKLDVENTDYVSFCGGSSPNWVERGLVVLDPTSRIRVNELKDLLASQSRVTIIDVRSSVEFGICNLPGSNNIPLSMLVANPAEHLPGSETCVVVCRLGNDSQIAVDALRSVANSEKENIRDLVGGLVAWSKTIDDQFPIY